MHVTYEGCVGDKTPDGCMLFQIYYLQLSPTPNLQSTEISKTPNIPSNLGPLGLMAWYIGTHIDRLPVFQDEWFLGKNSFRRKDRLEVFYRYRHNNTEKRKSTQDTITHTFPERKNIKQALQNLWMHSKNYLLEADQYVQTLQQCEALEEQIKNATMEKARKRINYQKRLQHIYDLQHQLEEDLQSEMKDIEAPEEDVEGDWRDDVVEFVQQNERPDPPEDTIDEDL